VRHSLAAFLLGALALSEGGALCLAAQNAERDPTAQTTAVPAPEPRSAGVQNTESGTHGLSLRTDTEAPVFKQGGESFGSLLWRAAWGLLLIGGLAFAMAVLVKRVVPGIRGYSADGKKRIQLIETHRVTPKLTLLLIAYEDREILLAQSGDRLLELDTRAKKRTPITEDAHDA
jgi:hypothetical protein